MKWLIRLLIVVILIGAFLAWAAYYFPRPTDTTDLRIFEGDASSIDYCALPLLDGSGKSSRDIPKAYTPGCGWARFPMPILAGCTEPIPAHIPDLRGLWRGDAGGRDHIERVEQCGDRIVVTASGIIHDFRADGTIANGSRDVEPPSCRRTLATMTAKDGVLNFHPFGLPTVIVTRRLEGDDLIWTYPRLGTVRMKRICQLPPEALTRK